jgi:hypothetical protein
MLRAIIEVVKSDSGTVVSIGTLIVENMGGDDTYGDYRLKLHEHAGNGKVYINWIYHYPRGCGALELIKRALNKLLLDGVAS